MFLPLKCGCGNCTVDDWMQGHLCSQKRKEYYPKFILLQQDSPTLSSLLKPNLDIDISLLAQTRNIIEVFNDCYSLTMKNLHREVNGYFYGRRGWIPLAIDNIVRLLQNRLGLTVSQEIANVDQLNSYLKSVLRVSWFHFKPIALISKEYLNSLYPELRKKWIKYFDQFHVYCNDRKLKDCATILFNSQNDNIFILRVDEKYNDMKLSDISYLCESLCFVLDCHELSVHLITAVPGSLQLYFGYCSEDYITRFQYLTQEQILCLADLKVCRILSLRDIENRFVYPNIQNTVCLYFDVSGHIIIITFLFLRLHHI